MATKIQSPTLIKSEGNKPKIIEEFIGKVNSGATQISIAKMQSPGGWLEPGQTPEFDEYTVVTAGTLRVETRDGSVDINAGEAVVAPKGEWVRYSSPSEEGAEYIAVCLPAFDSGIVHRDD